MRKTKSAILEAVHETASGFYRAGAISQTTMQEFEQLCSQPIDWQLVSWVEPKIFNDSMKQVAIAPR